MCSISFDLSKAFDREHWPSLLTTLFEQKCPQHLPWVKKTGRATDNMVKLSAIFGRSDSFPITGGARHGCVLSPRLFPFPDIIKFAMRKWRHAVVVHQVPFNQVHVPFLERAGSSRICCGAYWKVPLTLPIFPFITGIKNFCIGNPWGEGGLGSQTIVRTANRGGIVVIKDWVTGTKVNMTTNFGSITLLFS